jgi:hypothetical protein
MRFFRKYMEQNISMLQLKEQRMSPAERFVLETIKGAKASKPCKNGDVWWYNKDGKWLFRQGFGSGYLFVSNNIYSFLLKEYNLKSNEIEQLIKSVMYKYTNNGELIPVGSSLARQKKN